MCFEVGLLGENGEDVVVFLDAAVTFITARNGRSCLGGVVDGVGDGRPRRVGDEVCIA